LARTAPALANGRRGDCAAARSLKSLIFRALTRIVRRANGRRINPVKFVASVKSAHHLQDRSQSPKQSLKANWMLSIAWRAFHGRVKVTRARNVARRPEIPADPEAPCAFLPNIGDQ